MKSHRIICRWLHSLLHLQLKQKLFIILIFCILISMTTDQITKGDTWSNFRWLIKPKYSLRHFIFLIRGIACQIRNYLPLFGCLFLLFLLTLFCTLLHIPLTLETDATFCAAFWAFRHFIVPLYSKVLHYIKDVFQKHKSQYQTETQDDFFNW